MTAQCAGKCNLITTVYNELMLCLTTHVPDCCHLRSLANRESPVR